MSLTKSGRAVLAIGSQRQEISLQVQGTQSKKSEGCTKLPLRPPITLLADGGVSTLAGVDSKRHDTRYLLGPANGGKLLGAPRYSQGALHRGSVGRLAYHVGQHQD